MIDKTMIRAFVLAFSACFIAAILLNFAKSLSAP